jgi:hypothetical protein
MPLESDNSHLRFSLFDKEDVADALRVVDTVVTSTLVALLGLIITPSTPSAASMGWEQVGAGGSCCTPALAGSMWASFSRGGVSILLALTGVPSLS